MSESLASRVARYRASFADYAAECLRVVDKNGEMVPFELNRVQRALDRMVQEDIDAGRPVRMYILKARQMGCSTYWQGRAYHTTTLSPHKTAIVVAHEVTSAAELFAKSQMFHQRIERDLRPLTKRNNRRELLFENPDPDGEPGLNSKLIVMTADNDNLGASQTIAFAHLSEMARYEKINKNVKAALTTLYQAIPRRAGTFSIIETTAQGFGYAKDVWDDEKNGYRKIFFSWVADEEYRCDAPLELGELSPLEDGPHGNEERVLAIVLAELERWYPELPAEQREFEALCRLAWRRQTINEECQGDLRMFQQEYPITAEEAFLTTGTSAFDSRRVSDYRDAATTAPTLYRYDREVRTVTAARHGDIRVYELPKPGVRYVIGADAAEGLRDGDNAGIQILRVPELVQVVSYNARITPDDFADLLFVLGRMYNWAWICPEVNGAGLPTVMRLTKRLAYPTVYRREKFDQMTRNVEKKWGWQTNRATKAPLINDLQSAFRDDLLLLRDVATLDEMAHYMELEPGKYGAAQGKNDDLVIALALALQQALAMNFTSLGKRFDVEQAAASTGAPKKWTFDWWASLGDEGNEEAYG